MAGVRLGTRQMVLITALASATGVGTQYAMYHVIGFPLPFSLVIGTLSWASSMIALFLLSSGKRFQQSVAFRASMKNFVIVFLGQISLTLIYLTYIFGLVSVHHHLQSTFVLAPRRFRRRSCSWRSISHRDVDAIVAEIPAAGHAYSGKNCAEVALLIIDDAVTVRAHSSLRMFSLRSLTLTPTGSMTAHAKPVAWPFPALSFHVPAKLSAIVLLSPSVPVTLPLVSFASDKPMIVLNQSSARSHPQGVSLQARSQSGDTRIFTSAERLRFVQKCTHLLFITEFPILIEYTEVIIPVIYSLYVFAVLLKNHEFYPQLAHLEGPELGRMMSNIFIYVVLELMSLIMMTYVLKKKFRIDTTWQLTFVLERQWTMVQSKIFMWLFYIVQTSLAHFGADFSFQFVWLHTGFQGPLPTPLSL